MPELHLSKTLCIKGADGEYYRHTVKYTPPDLVTITKTKRSWLFWKKEVQEQVGLTKTEGFWSPKTVVNQEAIDVLEEQVHAIALAHLTHYDKDFQQATIDETGATFDKEPKQQPHIFSVVAEPFRKKLTETSSASIDSTFREYVSKNFVADYLRDVQATHLFNRFANQPLPPYQLLSKPKNPDVCPPPSGRSSPRRSSHGSLSSSISDDDLITPSPSLEAISIASEDDDSRAPNFPHRGDKATELDAQLDLFNSLVFGKTLTREQQILQNEAWSEFL